MRFPVLSPQILGILAMSAAGAVFSGHDAVTKFLAAHYPLGEIIFFRQISALVLLTAFITATEGLGTLKVRNGGGQVLRASFFTFSTVLIAASVVALPLSTALAIVFASPLVVAALSAATLGEPVGPRRWGAIIAGFIGVLVIIRPGGTSFSWLLLIPVAAACASAFRDITTRILHRTDSTNSILFWSNVFVIAVAACSLPFAWVPLAPEHIGFVVLAGGLNVLAHFLTITALRLGDAALVTPYRYTALVWAALLGYAIWGDVPDMFTIAGALIIVAAGVYLVVRESQVKRAEARAMREANEASR